jgi:hypothetical protein
MLQESSFARQTRRPILSLEAVRSRQRALGSVGYLAHGGHHWATPGNGVNMPSQVVNLRVTASIPIAYFWSEDDGWKGLCKSPSVRVCGSSFEDAKKNMAAELQTHIERIIDEHPKKSARRIA